MPKWNRPHPGQRTWLICSMCLTTLLGCGLQWQVLGKDAKESLQKVTEEVKAVPEDVASMETIIAALYDTISGPAGPRDWPRLRGLFLPGARLIPCGRRQDGTIAARVLSVDEFIQASAPRTKNEGFFEREISRRTERFGAVAHVFSTYESRRAKDDTKPFVRGINSIQLFFDGRRWWVVTIFWDSERPDQPLPAEFLPRSTARSKS
jgi:hypothetical protein